MIDTSNSVTYSLTNDGCIPTVFSNNHKIIYLWRNSGIKMVAKVGELNTIVDCKTVTEAFERSYAAASRYLLGTRIEVLAFFIFENNTTQKAKFDNQIRDLINLYHSSNKNEYPFFCPGKDGEDNSERIENFDFERDLIKFKKIMMDYTKNEVSIKKPFQYLHKSQENYNQEGLDKLRKYKKCLYNIYTGSGKTTLTPHMVAQICDGGDIAIFSTPIVDTLIDLQAKVALYRYEKSIYLITDDDLDKSEKQLLSLIEEKRKNNIILMAFSVQNIRYDDSSNGSLRKKFNFLNKLKIKLQVQDERHSQYDAKKTSDVFANIKSEYTLDLTATAFRLFQKYSDKYTQNQILSRDIFWVLREKKNGNADFASFPDIEIRSCDFTSNVLSEDTKKMYTESEEFNSNKQFEVVNGNFLHENVLTEMMNLMINSRDHTGRLVSEKKNQFYIFRSDLPVKDFALIKLPEGDADYSAQERCEMFKNLMTKTVKGALYKTAAEFKYQKNRGKINDEILEEWKNEANELGYQRVVIITHDQLCVGTDLVPLSIVVLMDKVLSPDFFLQIVGRCTRIYPNKNKVNIYAMVAGMNINLSSMIYQVVKDKSSDVSAQKEMYDCIPITHYMSNSVQTISFQDAIKNNHSYLSIIIDGASIPSEFFGKFETLVPVLKKYVSLDKLKGIVSNGDLLSLNNNSKTDLPTITNKNGTKSSKNELKKVTEILSCMYSMVMPLVIMENHKSVDSVWNGEIANKIFAKNYIKLAKEVLEVEELKVILNDKFNNLISNLNDLDLSEIIMSEKWFVNQSFLSDNGIEWATIDQSQKMIDMVDDTQEIKNIGVINGLNGLIPLMLRKSYPNAKISCIEYFNYFKNHLKNLNFDVYSSIEDVEENMDVVIFDCKSLSGIKSTGNKTSWNKRFNSTIKSLTKNGQIVGTFEITYKSLNSQTSKVLKDNLKKMSHIYDWNRTTSIFSYKNNKTSSVTKFSGHLMNEVCGFDVKKFDVLPSVLTKETLSIFEKLHNVRKIDAFVKVQTHHSLKHKNSTSPKHGICITEEKTSQNIYPLVHGTNVSRKREDNTYIDDMRVLYTNKKHVHQDVKKFAISRGDKSNKFTIIDKGIGVTHDVIYIPDDGKFDFKTLNLFSSSKIYKFFMKYSRYSNFNEEYVMNRVLPYFDVDVNIDNIDIFLYKKLNLNDREIEFVENNYLGV